MSFEHRRIKALESYGVLDTPPEVAFDRFTQLAADLFDAPIALVSLVDAERQWFKSRHGLDACETPRAQAFCAHTIEVEPGGVFVVEDASLDARFAQNPLVTSAPDIRFYAGAPLTTKDGFNLGSLCVIDSKARPAPSEKLLKRLKILAHIVVDELESRRISRQNAVKQRLLDLAESMSGVGSWRFKVADGSVEWSDEVYRIHGESRETFNPNLDDALGFYDNESRPKVEAFMANAIAERSGFSFQLQVLQRDGTRRDVVCKAACEIDDKGEVSALVGVFQDVTDAERTIRKAQQNEARYRLLADNMGDVVTRIGRDGRSSYVSPAITSLLGYAPVEMAGRPAQAFVYPDDQPVVLQAMASLGEVGTQTTLQHRAVRKDGSTLWVETNFQLVRDANGAGDEIVAVVRDITERKTLEEQLRSAQAAAEAATTVKSEFLANMSHELRTPLTAVLGFSKLVAEQPELSPRTRHFADRLTTAGRLLLASVNDILDFSKLEAGQVEILPENASPSSCIGETVGLLEETAHQKGLSLTLEGLNDLPPVLCFDADRVRQIIMNLAGNAVKFTSMGGVRVEARYTTSTSCLTVRVHDTGPGIGDTERLKLFQRFSQVDGSSTRRHAGTGLGLAICKGLVEAMGGEIGVSSEVGHGSCFWFMIPAAPVSLPSAAAAIENDENADRLVAGCRILLADDNEINRKLVKAMLEPHSVEISEATNGREALDLASAQPFDLILMDLRMPVMDGADAASRIRQDDGPNSGVPILAFSADLHPAIAAELFDGVLSKPISHAGLLQAVHKARQLDPGAKRNAAA